MKKFLLLGGVAALLFSISAGISYFMNKGDPSAVKGAADPSVSEKRDPFGNTAQEDVSAPGSGALFPPGHSPTVDSAAKIVARLNARERELETKERAFARRQKQLKLVLKDIKDERASLDKLRGEVTEMLAQAKGLVGKLETKAGALERRETETERKINELSTARIQFDAEEIAAIKDQAAQFEKMNALGTANLFGHLAKTGMVDDVAKYLAFMSDKQGAKVLEEIEKLDQQVSAELVGKIIEVRQIARKLKPK